MSEKKRNYPVAFEGYNQCLEEIAALSAESTCAGDLLARLVDIRAETMLRIALLRKETGQLDQSMLVCTGIVTEAFSESARANALCIKGLLHEMRAEFPASEVVYRYSLSHSVTIASV
jgi:hypothetical protein